MRLLAGDRIREKATGRTGTVLTFSTANPDEEEQLARVAFDDGGPDKWLWADEVYVIREPAAEGRAR